MRVHRRAVLAILPLLLAPTVVQSQVPASGGADTVRTFINSTGRATVRVPPDRATILLVVQSNTATPADAAESVTRLERAVVDTLLKLGVPRAALTSTPYGVSPARPTRDMGGVGGSLFTGRSVIALRVTQLDRMAMLTAAAFSRGAVLVGQPRFESSAEDSARAAAFREAVADAQKQGTALAEGLGGRLGRLRDISGDEPYRYDPQQQGFLPSEAPYDSGNRQPPEVMITVMVRARWELLPAR